ncbi:hypothetical protein HMPREF1545_03402 [Oscillibacter sp. KLE 1728]|nr:hypothetical protein HMPREF1545_03402 [Oscillibacter sp. KLE 1728]
MSAIIHAPPCYAAEEPWDALPQNTPCSIMASATRLKPAMLAPATRVRRSVNRRLLILCPLWLESAKVFLL